MASAALPFVFEAQRIGNEFYGDGSLRLTSPLSPAIHCGADRILGDRHPRCQARTPAADPSPSTRRSAR